jgi:outer membrane protein assembly factor BamB
MAVLAGSALGLAGSTASVAAASGQPAARTTAAACVRHAFAAELALNGKAIWRTAMAATTEELQTSFTPAVGATVGYWPEDGIVHALRLKDGKELWHFKQGFSLNGVWLNHGVVAVLTDDFGGNGQLTGLNATTGKAVWRVTIPGKGLTIGGPVATADGGLAWVRADGQLQVVDLTSGKVRWSQRQGTPTQIGAQFPQLETLGAQVFYLAAGRLSAYNDKTGAVAWSEHKMPVHTSLDVAAGDLLLNGGWPSAPFAIGAVDPVHGATSWTYASPVALTLLAGGSGRIAVAAETGPLPLHEFMLDAQTGLVDWQTDTQLLGNPVLIRTLDTVSVEGDGDYDKPALLVDRSLADGHVLWQTTLHHQAATAQSLTLVGSSVMINPDAEFANPDNPLYGFSAANGHAAWTNATLLPLQADPVLTKKTMLVSAADDPDSC